MDQIAFEHTAQIDSNPTVAVQRQLLYVPDSNANSYSGSQVIIETSSIANSGKFINWSEGFLTIPLVLRLTAGTNANVADFQALNDSFAVFLKNGHYQLIHSMSVEFQNQTIVQLTPYLNHYVNYKVLSTWSPADLEKYGEQLGVWPDDAVSQLYDRGGAVMTGGHGSINNNNTPVLPGSLDSYEEVRGLCNYGAYKRSLNTAFNPALLSEVNAAGDRQTSAAFAGQVGMNFYERDGDSQYWYVLATIRLKDVCDYFDKVGMHRNGYYRFTLHLNTSSQTVTMHKTAANAFDDISCTSSTVANGSTVVMLASGGGGLSAKGDLVGSATVNPGAATTYTFTLASSIVKDTNTNKSHPTHTACRLYVPAYQLTPEKESELLSLVPTKTINYSDIYNYNISVSTNNGVGSFSQLLTNGIAGLERIVICPYIGSASNPLTSAGANLTAPYQSPFASEPGTTSPYIILKDINCRVAGINIALSNYQYDFETFKQELAPAYSLNGGLVDTMTSGLINYERFQKNMRYYTFDLSRRLPEEDTVPKAVELFGQVLSYHTSVQLMVFLVYSKKLTMDVSSGLRLEE